MSSLCRPIPGTIFIAFSVPGKHTSFPGIAPAPFETAGSGRGRMMGSQTTKIPANRFFLLYPGRVSQGQNKFETL